MGCGKSKGQAAVAKVVPESKGQAAAAEVVPEVSTPCAASASAAEVWKKAQAAAAEPCSPCATDGCVYYRTWHKTHCCKACRSNGCHGGLCDKKVNLAAQAAIDDKMVAIVAAAGDPYAFLKKSAKNNGSNPGRKLNVVCLHGITGDGEQMNRISKPLREKCADIADFYCPSAPHPITKDHSWCKKHNRDPGPQSRTWTLEDGGGRKDFADYLIDYVETQVPGPVDVLLGHSQGGYAIHQLFENSQGETAWEKTPSAREKLHAVRAVIILMSGGKSNRSPPTKLKALHIAGANDTMVEPQTSMDSSRSYADGIFTKLANHDHYCPFTHECVAFEHAFLQGMYDFHSAFPKLCDMESE